MRKEKRTLPKISIVIPSYNKVSYIEATLCSIVEQRYPNLEVIVQDGKSTDGTVEVIKRFARKYPRLFKWESKKDGGQVDAINKGLEKASGDLLAFINADDVYKKEALLEIGKEFQQHTEALWLAGYGDIINSKGMVISPAVTNYKNLLIRINKFPLLLIVNYLTQPSTFISREAYRKLGPFSGTKNYVMEYDLWLKLGKTCMPFVIKKTLSSFRLTDDNISSTAAKQLLKIDNSLAEKYTNNSLFLVLHKLHNLGRIFLLNFV